MKQEHDLLSERDQLLQRRFRIKDPHRYQGLSKCLEKGAVPIRILHDYDETPPGGLKAGNKPHIRCCFNHLHWRGYVTEFEDGCIALLGQNCARRDFGADVINAIENTFNAERDRQYQIRRLLAVRETLPAALTELRKLDLSGFDIVWQTMMRRHGKASQALAKSLRSCQGRLIAYRNEIDREATELKAEEARPELFGSRSRTAVAAQKKYIEKNPVYIIVPSDMGPCDGWELLMAADHSTPAKLVAEAIALLIKADNKKPPERWEKTDFARFRENFDQVFQNLDEAEGLMANLLRFASATNCERISAWAAECKLEIEIRLPDGFGWPAMRKVDALRSAWVDRTD